MSEFRFRYLCGSVCLYSGVHTGRSGRKVPMFGASKNFATNGIFLCTCFTGFIAGVALVSDFILSNYSVPRRTNVRCWISICNIFGGMQENSVCVSIFSARCIRYSESSRYCHDVRPSVCLGRACIAIMHAVHFSADLSLRLDRPIF